MTPDKKRKSFDISCLSTTPKKVKALMEQGVPPGMFHTSIAEPMPTFDKAENEVLLEGKNNSSSWISC